MLITILAFAFVIGVITFVHELGHFIAAKRVGIRVLKFQLGFNPTVASFRRGDTVYAIGAIPLGGFVKMAGESPDDPQSGQSDEFLSKTKWQRFQVLIMGPAMNILLAIVLTAVVLYRGAEVPAFQDEAPIVGAVTAASAAAGADIKTGDRILTVDDHNVDTWEQFFLRVGTRPGRPTSLTILRDGHELDRTLTPTLKKGQSQLDITDIGVLPNVHPRVPAVTPGEPADLAGVKPGDVVVAVNGEPIVFSGQLKEAISKRPAQEITISILRGGSPLTLRATTLKRGDIGWLGISIADQTKTLKPGAFEAVGLSLQRNVQMAGLIGQTVWGLVTRETSPKQLLGPVAIAQLSGEQAQLGWIALLSLLASINLNLGLLNLLPIPVLDGGHIFILLIEGVARRDFSVRVKEKMLLAGFVFLLMLMVSVIYNDLTRIAWIGRLIPWK